MENWRVSLARILYDCSNKRCCRVKYFNWTRRLCVVEATAISDFLLLLLSSCLWYEKEFLLLTSTLEKWGRVGYVWRRRKSNGMWKNWESAGGLNGKKSCKVWGRHFSYFSLLNGGDRDSLTWNYFHKINEKLK